MCGIAQQKIGKKNNSEIVAILAALRTDIKSIKHDIRNAHLGIQSNQRDIKSPSDRQLRQFECERDTHYDESKHRTGEENSTDTNGCLDQP